MLWSLVSFFYCSKAWANTFEHDMSKLQSIQNFATRIVTRARKYDHVTPVPKELKWLPVATQSYLRNAVMAFKCVPSCVSEYQYLSSQFIKRREMSRCTTRSSQMLNIPLFKTAGGRRTVGIWNSMDSYLRTFKSVSAFKFNMKHKLLCYPFSHSSLIYTLPHSQGRWFKGVFRLH